MTLFIKMPNRSFEISDLYVMALSFILFYSVTTITVKVIKNQKEKKRNYNKPRGGKIELDGVAVTDESELGLAILSCIANDHSYVVKHPTVKRLIFDLVKEKITNQSLVITPNLMRYLATRLIDHDRTIITQLGNVVVQTESRNRLLTRVAAAAVGGVVAGAGVAVSYGILLAGLVFLQTENCFTPSQCNQYFEPVPKERPLEFYRQLDSGHLFVTDEDKQVAIYTPSSKEAEISISPTGEHIRSQTYNKDPKIAKKVTFEDFTKVDPELLPFKEQGLEEPQIPRKSCLKGLEQIPDGLN